MASLSFFSRAPILALASAVGRLADAGVASSSTLWIR